MADETTAAPHGRAWVRAVVAAVPHVLILGIVYGTLAGMAVVILAALVVGNGDTWR